MYNFNTLQQFHPAIEEKDIILQNHDKIKRTKIQKRRGGLTMIYLQKHILFSLHVNYCFAIRLLFRIGYLFIL